MYKTLTNQNDEIYVTDMNEMLTLDVLTSKDLEALREECVADFVNLNDLFPETSTQGVLTSEQLSVLQENTINYVLFNSEIYRLNADNQTEGYLTYSCVDYENGTTMVKTITITIATQSWVLNKVSVTELNNYLPLSGGIMTGPITLTDEIAIQDSNGKSLLRTNETFNYIGNNNKVLHLNGRLDTVQYKGKTLAFQPSKKIFNGTITYEYGNFVENTKTIPTINKTLYPYYYQNDGGDVSSLHDFLITNMADCYKCEGLITMNGIEYSVDVYKVDDINTFIIDIHDLYNTKIHVYQSFGNWADCYFYTQPAYNIQITKLEIKK